MTNIESIRQPIAEAFERFEARYDGALQSDNPLLNRVVDYVTARKGKQLRPMLVLLSAQLAGGITEATLASAVAFELFHTATLIHDDVVDETLERRGKQSVNAAWDNKVAVLAGDYFLSKSLNEATRTRQLNILAVISKLGETLSNGELLQLDVARQSLLDEQSYFNVIRKKTAELFADCCLAGVLSVSRYEPALAETMHRFGELLGICFQLKDDVFDYFPSTQEIGKPTGNDIREGKITLPLLYALREIASAERDEALRIINAKAFAEKNIPFLTHFAIANGGIDYAQRKMDEFKLTAKALLLDLPESSIKTALFACVDYAVERNK